jgi:hypothetical protein
VLAFLGEIFARHPIMSNTSTTHEFSRTTEPLFKETSMAILTMPHPTMGQSLPTAIILVLGDPTMMNISVGLLEDEVTPFLHVRFAMVMKYIEILTLPLQLTRAQSRYLVLEAWLVSFCCFVINT